MSTKVKPIPDGYEGAMPYLICKGAAKAIEFYKKYNAELDAEWLNGRLTAEQLDKL